MKEAEQVEEWVEFYEAAWKFRHELFKKFLASSPSLYVALHRLSRFERKFKLFVDPKGEPQWLRKTERGPLFPNGVPITHISSVKESFFEEPSYQNPMEYLLDYLEEDSKFDALIELGSGFGQNLIELAYGGAPRIPFYAGEYTKSGQAFLKDMEEEFGKLGRSLTTFPFDHKNPSLNWVKERGRLLFFTCHTIEQVTSIDEKLILAIRDLAEKVVCFHFEPFGFQLTKELNEKSPVSRVHAEMFEKCGWNQNLASVLMDLDRSSAIKLTYMGKNVFSSGCPDNPTSLAIWEHSF